MVNGYRKEKDIESQERLIIMRNLMFAMLVPHSKQIKKPEDIIKFDFEKATDEQKMDLSDALAYEAFQKEIEAVKQFYGEK